MHRAKQSDVTMHTPPLLTRPLARTAAVAAAVAGGPRGRHAVLEEILLCVRADLHQRAAGDQPLHGAPVGTVQAQAVLKRRVLLRWGRRVVVVGGRGREDRRPWEELYRAGAVGLKA
jgi:hypothetical protein